MENNYTLDYINRLIETKAEENLHLDFKASGALDFSNRIKTDEEIKNEIAKDVSAFANSEGGIIIYGLKEKKHIAKKISPIDGGEVSKERLEQIIQSRIKRPIKNLKIKPIRIDDDIQKSIYIVIIPQSDDFPHMSSDGCFYKRNNFNNVKYMEYELRRDYLTQKSVNLNLQFPVINKAGKVWKERDGKGGLLYLWFFIKNEGKVLEKNFKLQIDVPSSIVPKGSHEMHKFKDRTFDGKTKYTIPSTSAIFPDERLKLCGAHFAFTNTGGLSQKIKMTLYYSSGIKELKFTLEELFENQIKRNEITS